ncbi:MAG: response regulator [Deltaproteobacteria bacterium]|nr:response regulator [Deltaproteobacteria bacterium]MBW2136515.1 response regulator [Deltaproteobacteria bacterium]
MSDEDILKDKKILIVDDEQDILETLEDLLDMCLIDSAPSFETGKKFLEKNAYDAAIFDIMGVKGYDLLKLATQRDVPVIMLTAHALGPDHLVKSIKEGAHSYVPKDKILEIESILRDLILAHEKGIDKHGQWFARLKPFFDRKFGPNWRDKDREFWDEFDRKRLVKKEELQDML